MTGESKKKLVRILIDGKLETLAWAASKNGSGEYEIRMGVRNGDGRITKKYFPAEYVVSYYQNKYPGKDVRIELR